MYGIFTYIWLIFMVNVGKYTSPMDPMGYIEGNFSLTQMFSMNPYRIAKFRK